MTQEMRQSPAGWPWAAQRCVMTGKPYAIVDNLGNKVFNGGSEEHINLAIKSVNSHDALVNALQKTIGYILDTADKRDFLPDTAAEIVKEASAALTAAGVKGWE